MLLRVCLLDIPLGNLLHHEVAIDHHILGQLAAGHAPLARDCQDADGGFGVDERVDAGGDVGEGELVCCLWIVSMLCFDWRHERSHLANGLLVGYAVGGRRSGIARFEGVADERWAEGLDHELVVVESGNDDGGIGVADGSLNVGGRHFDECVVVWISEDGA